MLDIDDFKRVNDLLGHDTGTATLRALATLLRAHARPSDLVVRYGGDEFVVLLPATPKPDAARVAETFRTAMKSQWGQPGDGSAPLAVTVRVGVATCPGDARSGTELFVAADRALYDAKIAGKDCVRLCGESARSYARRKLIVHDCGIAHIASINDIVRNRYAAPLVFKYLLLNFFFQCPLSADRDFPDCTFCRLIVFPYT